jgi:hypothetical protein
MGMTDAEVVKMLRSMAAGLRDPDPAWARLYPEAHASHLQQADACQRGAEAIDALSAVVAARSREDMSAAIEQARAALSGERKGE